jgi:hypothetical protein
MKFAAGIVVFSIILATIFGVAFSMVYPLVEIDGNLITLFAVLGLAASLICVGLWKIANTKSPDSPD